MPLHVVDVKPDQLNPAPFPGVEEFRLWPLGDIQNAALVDRERVERTVAHIVRSNGYVVGMGDLVDVASPSNRSVLQSIAPHIYDSTGRVIAKAAYDVVLDTIELLRPLKGRILGYVSGHHWFQFGKDYENQTSTQIIAGELGGVNHGDGAGVYILRFKKGSKELQAKVWTHHGVGGGITEGASLTRLGHMTKGQFAHVYIMGHVSKLAAFKIPWVDFEIVRGQPKSVGGNRYLVISGGFMYGYSYEKAGDHEPDIPYPEKRMLPPVALGSPTIYIRPIWAEERIDVNVSI